MTAATSTLNKLVLTRPDDWHLHVRDGAAMASVVPATARQFGRAIIMPNLRPPVTNAEQATAYAERIRAAVPAGMKFDPLMVLYLTNATPAEEVAKAKAAGAVAFKLYPAGATTNSDAGVTDLRATYSVLEAMQKQGMVFCVHGEVTDSDVDVFDREKAFIDTKLIPLRRDFPELKIVFEHITTKEAAQYVTEADRFVGATITPQHLLYNRNAIFTGGIRPHYYCLPVLKRETHRLALVEAATGGKVIAQLVKADRGRGEDITGPQGLSNSITATVLEAAGGGDHRPPRARQAPSARGGRRERPQRAPGQDGPDRCRG